MMQINVSGNFTLHGTKLITLGPTSTRRRPHDSRRPVQAVMTPTDSQVRHAESGADQDTLAERYGNAPSAAALRSMLSNDICPEHVRVYETVDTPCACNIDIMHLAPYTRLQAQEQEARVSGEFPPWLDGTLIRNGPGTFKGMQHLFDGYGMLSKFRFEEGHVWVSNRFVESTSWKSFRKAGKMEFAEFGTGVPQLKSIWNLVKQLSGIGQGFTDNSNVSVLPLSDGKTALAMTETVPGTYLVRISDLETTERVDFQDSVKGNLTTAHPAVLPDGSIVNFTSDIGGKYMVYRSRPGSPQRKKIAEIPLRSGTIPSWVHDFPYTENYMILPETPCYFDLKALASGTQAEYVIMQWKPEEDTLLHVVPLSGEGPVRSFRAPRYFTFHYMNAFETDDGKLHMDFSCYENPEILNILKLSAMREGVSPVAPGPLRRMTIDLADETKPATMAGLMQNDAAYVQAELPRVNPHHKGRAYRYGYSVAGGVSPTYNNALAKYDVDKGETTMWHEPGCLPTEPVMVPRQGDGPVAEDDGVVLSVVAGGDGRTFLLALDARSFTEVGRAHLPFDLTYSFHGNYLPRPASNAGAV